MIKIKREGLAFEVTVAVETSSTISFLIKGNQKFNFVSFSGYQQNHRAIWHLYYKGVCVCFYIHLFVYQTKDLNSSQTS